MKISIDKRIRLLLLVLSLGALLSGAIMIYGQYKFPSYIQEEKTLYSCHNKTEINYIVPLRSNLLYEEEYLEEGQTYITEFVDKIKANFNYDFNGKGTANIRGDYVIMTEIEAYTGQDENYKTLWKRQETLLPKKTFQAIGDSFSIRESFPLDIHQFNDFARLVIEESKITSNVKLTAYMKVNMEAETDQGLVTEELTSTMQVPLNTSYFEIGGDLIEEKDGKIQLRQEVALDPDGKKLVFFAVIVGLSLIVLIYLGFFVQGTEKKSPLEKRIKQIFKKYGDRLVALDEEITIGQGDYSQVKSIEDLVRISDELEKPILYKYRSNSLDISKFYLLDGKKIFLYQLGGQAKILEAEG